MSLTINEGSNFLKTHTFKRGDLILISISNSLHYGIYDGMKSTDKAYYYHVGGAWHSRTIYERNDKNGDSSWLYKKINDPTQGSVDYTNTNAIKRIFPIPQEMCTKLLLEIQHDFKKARNLL
jgi:hypothetical protein